MKVTETILAVESDALTPESTILSEKKPERTGTYRGPTRESYRASTHLGQLCKFMFEGQLIKSRPGPSEQMIFLINFVNHSYQFEWRLNVRCSRCAEIYRKCKEDMLGFLRDFLCGHDISIALEEGGTCISIIEALRANGNEKTILEEVIATISEKHISHGFVDITEKQATELLANKTITDVQELRNKKAELRDSYIARGAMTKLLEKENSNGLLLCADRHFSGVKQHLEQAEICVLSDSIDRYDWYISNDRIDFLHQNEHLS